MHTCFHRRIRFSGLGAIDLGHAITRRAENLADAVKVARETGSSSSWSLLVSSAREKSAAVLEIAGSQVAVRRPREEEDFLAQTNRYRCAELQSGEVGPSAGLVANSEGRYRVLRRRAEQANESGGFSLEDLQALLGSHQDPDDPGRERASGGVLAQPASVQSVVFDPQNEQVHVSVGPCPTGAGPYSVVEWDWDAPSGWTEIEPAKAREVTTSRRFSEGPAARGLGAYCQAMELQSQGHAPEQIAEALERAASLDPVEPTYRLLAGAYRLREAMYRAHSSISRPDWTANAPPSIAASFFSGRAEAPALWAKRPRPQRGRKSCSSSSIRYLKSTRNSCAPRSDGRSARAGCAKSPCTSASRT